MIEIEELTKSYKGHIIFDKLNLKVPKTYEEFKDVAEDIKEKAGMFLKDYCNFTQTDIDSLENRDRTSVIALLTRRMFDEE